MSSLPAMPGSATPALSAVLVALDRVRSRFDGQLASEFPPVDRLVRHVEHYRGKMLRPMLTIASGMAASPRAGSVKDLSVLVTDAHVTAAAVCEMVHMATLVHDDVLDEADTRRRGQTVNRLHGNETAVILGDLLIAASYHLCSQIDSQRSALLIGKVSMEMCEGELLQLHHRGDYSLDEPTYFEIVKRKTAALIAAACELGAMHAGAGEEVTQALSVFGSRVGVAFQIQDDVLDLTGTEASVGKSVGKDLEKAKLTLPVIHHLAAVDGSRRGVSLRTLEDACDEGATSSSAAAAMVELLHATGSFRHANQRARELIAEAKARLDVLDESPAKALLAAMADAAIDRAS